MSLKITVNKKQKMSTDFHLLRIACGKNSKLSSRHWLLLYIVQLIQAFAPIHHLLNWCRNSRTNIIIPSLARNPFLWRYYLRHQQKVSYILHMSSISSYLIHLYILTI